MIKTLFEFGEKILVIGEIKRHKIRNIRTWKGFNHPEREAIFLNGVNLADGEIKYISYGEEGGGYEFNPSQLIPGAWICEKNRKPRKVFLNMIKKLS